MRYEALRSRFHFVFIHFNSTSSGGQIDAGVNAQLFCKTRLRVMGSSPASQGLFGNGNLQNWQRMISVGNCKSAHKNFILTSRLCPS